MKKVITIIFFASLLYFGKSYAVNNDSTAYVKECFQKAKTEIENMLSGKIPLNYERAVFLTENAYWGNAFDDSLFSHLIDFHSKNIKNLAETNRTKSANDFKSDFISTKEQKQKYYDNDLYNWAIFKYLTDTTLFLYDGHFYYQKPVKYSTDDPLGTLHWGNSQVLNLLNPDLMTGNCMAMTSLFKIFSERLNTNANIGTAPGHVFIIHEDDKGTEYNVELATHSFPGAGSLMTLTYTSDKALRSGISMRTLDTKQSVNLCLVYLAKGYEDKFGVKDNDFMLQCAESALQYDSLNLNALLLKAEVLESRLVETNKTIKQLQKDSLFLQYQNLLSVLLDKGYYEMPSEMKDIILSKLRNENIPYFAVDHTPQPFKDINVKEDRYATLSGGLFDENPQPKPIERYGKTLFNTKTKKIIEFKEPDSTYSNYPIDPVVFAWSIDPLACKYPNLSPYVSFADNPIIYYDPDGKDIWVGFVATNTDANGATHAGHTTIEVTNYVAVKITINGKIQTYYKATGGNTLVELNQYVIKGITNSDYQLFSSDNIKQKPLYDIRHNEQEAVIKVQDTPGVLGKDITGASDADANTTYYTSDQIKNELTVYNTVAQLKEKNINKEVFNLRTNNCTDFAAKILGLIKINTEGQEKTTGTDKYGQSYSVANPNKLFQFLQKKYTVTKETNTNIEKNPKSTIENYDN